MANSRVTASSTASRGLTSPPRGYTASRVAASSTPSRQLSSQARICRATASAQSRLSQGMVVRTSTSTSSRGRGRTTSWRSQRPGKCPKRGAASGPKSTTGAPRSSARAAPTSPPSTLRWPKSTRRALTPASSPCLSRATCTSLPTRRGTSARWPLCQPGRTPRTFRGSPSRTSSRKVAGQASRLRAACPTNSTGTPASACCSWQCS